MAIGKLGLIVLMMAMLFPFCSGTGTKAPVNKNINDHFKKLLTIAELENVGFEHFDASAFKLLFVNQNLYILNCKDFMIVKLSGNTPLRVFKSRNGQAPKEMITPRSLFLYDDDTIAVFDLSKTSILFFDLDLNYIKEKKIGNRFRRMDRVGDNLAAMLNYKEENVFAVLDNNFEIVKTIIKPNKMPFEHFFPGLLNMGFFPGENIVAHSYWCFPYKECYVNIYDLNGKLVVTLHWEQPFKPTARTFKEGRNLYGSNHVGKYGSYYTVKCSHTKIPLAPRQHDFMIFDQKGVLKYRGDFPYDVIKVSNSPIDTRIYFMDNDEGISFINITDFGI